MDCCEQTGATLLAVTHDRGLLPHFRRDYDYTPGDFPVAESVSHRTLALPFFTRMTEREVDLVCQTLELVMTRQTFSRD